MSWSILDGLVTESWIYIMYVQIVLWNQAS